MRMTRRLMIGLACAALAVAVVVTSGCSLGPRVPDVRGKTLAEAQRLLEAAGYKQGETTRAYTPGATPGTIFQQYPAPGTKLAKGEAVALRIALPLGEMVVPQVTGKTAEEASANIVAASLTPKRDDEYSDAVANGTVIAQIPDAGAKVAPNAVVVYVVSKGKAPATAKVPNIVGKSKSDADTAIKNAGFVPGAQQVYSDTVAKDKIVIQSPAAGATAAPGSTVSYAVSLGKPTSAVSVPNVTGKSESDAVNAIKNAGLVAQVYRQASSSVPNGTVIAQMPPSGSKTAPGGTVGIAVSTGSESLLAVPDVKGKTEADATSALESAGFTVQSVSQPSADVPSGSVIGQSPTTGTKAPPGSTVFIAVSTGVPTPQ